MGLRIAPESSSLTRRGRLSLRDERFSKHWLRCSMNGKKALPRLCGRAVGELGAPRPGCARACQLSDRSVRGLCDVGQECPGCERVEGGDQKYRRLPPVASPVK